MSEYQDYSATMQVLACLVAKPTLLYNNKYIIQKEDFLEELHIIILQCIKNLVIKKKVTTLDAYVIDSFLSKYPKQYEVFQENLGIKLINDYLKLAKVENFDFYYINFKKYSLLRRLEENGFDISEIYTEDENEENYEKINNKFHTLSISDIIQKIDIKLIKIKEDFMSDSTIIKSTGGNQLKELVDDLKETPEFGLPFYSAYLSEVCMGARKGTFVIRSAPSGCGKTRTLLGDACYLAFPKIYDIEKQKWIKTNHNEKILFLTTELSIPEIQTMLLAFVAGVDEAKILIGEYTEDEATRVEEATNIINNGNFIIERHLNFSTNDILETMKLQINLNKTEYIFFDYIHITPKILGEMANDSKGLKLREDLVLLMFCIKLKAFAEEHDVFIMSATQLNSEWSSGVAPNQNMLRGAKSMADKIDIGIIALKPTRKELNNIKSIQEGLCIQPNLIYHVYKNRRSKYVSIKIWLNANLGLCRTEDLFITDEKNKLITFDKIKHYIENDNNYQEYQEENI